MSAEKPKPGQSEPEAEKPEKEDSGLGIKAPLIFSAVLGIVAGVVVTITATGGLNNPDKPLRIDLGLIAFGIAFIASLVTVALLQLSAKDNPEELGQGTGINRSSEEMYRQAVARAREKKRAEAEAAEKAAQQEKGDSDKGENPSPKQEK